VHNPCVICAAPASIFINLNKSAAAVAIRGDADACVNLCAADGSGTKGRSSRAPSRRSVRGVPDGGRFPVALDRVRGLRQEHRHIIQ
jgi:hypothetical protein